MILKIKITYKDLVSFYTWGVKLLVFAIPFLSLYVSHPLFFPFITGRNFAFRILVEIASALWLGLAVLSKEYRPRFSKIGSAVLIFLLVAGLADLLGVDPFHSFWSRYERMEGLVALLHLGIYFLLLSSVFNPKKDWLILFNLFLFSGFINGIYGMMQRFGVVSESIQGGFRPDGLIGNPTYLAGYLVLTLALCFITLVNTQAKWRRNLYIGISAFFVIVVYMTATRGSLLALLIAAFLFLVSYFLIRFKALQKKIRVVILGVLISLLLIPLAFWLLKNTGFVQNNDILSRFTSISLEDTTIKARFLVWNISWQGFKERPLLGWGQENYTQVFSKYYDPRLYNQEPWFDRSHNIIFDWLINAGILGLLSFMTIFTTAFLVIRSLVQRKTVSLEEGLVIFTALVAYLIQNLFVFDNFNTYILLFGLLAYINNLDTKSNLNVSKTAISKQFTFHSLTVFGLGLSLVCFALYFLNIKPILQAKGIVDSLKATATEGDSVGNTLSTFKQTLSYNTFGNVETIEQFSRSASLLVDQDFSKEEKSEFVKAAISNTESYLEEFPNDIRLHLMAAQLYGQASGLDPVYLDKAKEHIQKALELSPKKQAIYSLLAENYLARKDYETAIETIREAIALNPLNNQAYENLGVVAVLADKKDIVQEAILKLIELKEKHNLHTGILVENLVAIGTKYIVTQKFDKARDVFEMVVSYEPTNPQYRANLAGLYLNQGMFERAIEEVRKAAELDPEKFGQLAVEFEKKVNEYIRMQNDED